MPNAVIHPSAQELTAFALGKLSETAATTVAGHLEKCPSCRKAVENLPADSFMGKVRAAKPDASSLPARAGGVPNVPAIVNAPVIPPKDLPPDLAHYAKYRFVRELGRGGMGVVYQAEQTVMGRTVAVKVINPSVLDHPDALPRFQGEVKAAAKLDHPNIVRAHDAEQVGSMHLLVMEFVEGTSLAELVAKKGPLSVAHACHYVRQAALGLQHAFEQGMVHRDIKPQNLMVNARGQVKVLDFGLARMRSERNQGGGLTQADAFMGTPEYVSPEQATDAHSADTRADIYSLGCTLFFLLTGRPPFQAGTAVKLIMAHIEKEPPSLQDVRADVPPELSAVVARMLAKDPAQRFQTPVEVAQALAVFVKPGTKRTTAGTSSSTPDVASPGTGTVIAADTSKIKAILRDVPNKETPAKDEAFAGLGEGTVSAKKKAKPARKTAEPAPAAWYRRGPVLAGVGAAVLALGLGVWLLAGVVFKTKVKTPNGEAYVVLEIDQPDAEVTVDGQKINVHVPGDNKPVEIQVEPGRSHKLRVRKDGFEIVSRDVELKSGKSAPIRVRLEPVKVAVIPEEQPATPRPAPPSAPEKQAEAVARELKVRNPGFDGKWAKAPGIEGDKVVSLFIASEHVRDLNPLQGLPYLRSLILNGTKVTDLTPLQGLPLNFLHIHTHHLSDLSPLSGMKGLETLVVIGAPLTDLKPLQGLKLWDLTLHDTPVEDLSPLKGMPLKGLNISRTRVKDLSPLKGMELETFIYNEGTPVKDIAVLKEMPLRGVLCDFHRERDEAVLRSIKTLETINRKPAAQFWKEVDGTNTSGGSPTKEGQIPPKSPNVAAEEKGLVPLFNGKNLAGWQVTEGGRIAMWGAENGVLHMNGRDGGWLMTEKEYGDFELRLEFKLSEKGNSGVALRSAMKGNPAGDAGMEIQLLDDDWYTKNLKGMKPEMLTGSIFGIVPPSRNALKPVGEWNAMNIVAKGRNMTVVLNGTEIVNANLDAYKAKVGTHPGMQRTTGHIGLQSSDGHVEFRKIEIKELPAAKSEAPPAAKSEAPPAPRAKSDLPPEAKAAAKAFEKSREEARAKLLAEFDTALDRLSKSKGSTEERLKLIEVVKEEKKRFENRGLIPWSEPMRPFLAKYFAATSNAESKVRRIYKSLIDAQLRAKNENMVAALRADLENLLSVRVVARWRHFLPRYPTRIFSLYSNGSIGNSDGKAIWSYAKGVLIFRWPPDPKAPGGAWIDTLMVSEDGMSYAGTNNDSPQRRPKLTGVYVKDE